MDIRVIIIVLILALAGLQPAAAEPKIVSVKPGRANSAVIQGQAFGNACRECEVIADFGGFKYAYPVDRWSKQRIVAKITDIGKGNNIKIAVRTADGLSRPVSYRIPTQVVPAKKIKRIVKPNSVPDLLLFEHHSKLSVGDKGEERYDVSQAAPACGQKGYVFDSADLIQGRDTRFGEAKFVGLPKVGCSRCQPIRVRWYHEPTGKLHFQVHVYRREIEGICPNQVRR